MPRGIIVVESAGIMYICLSSFFRHFLFLRIEYRLTASSFLFSRDNRECLSSGCLREKEFSYAFEYRLG